MIPLYAIAYRLSARENDSFRLTVTYVKSHGEGVRGWVRCPQSFDFRYPPYDGIPRRFGTSETFGLLGGVSNEKQSLYSEACERSIGDVLTSIICEILDGDLQGDAPEATILIFGVAFPKVVGRILSLRPPETVGFLWLCPRPFPEWIAEGVNQSAIIGLHGWGVSTEWEDEHVLITSEMQAKDGSSLVIQKLDSWGALSDRDVPAAEHLKKDLCGAPLPKEIIAAAEQIEVEMEEPYKHYPEERLRRPHDAVQTLTYEQAVAQQQSSPPGWEIAWDLK